MKNLNLLSCSHSKNPQFYYHSKQGHHNPIKLAAIGVASLKIQVYLQEAIQIINSSFYLGQIDYY
jgi:hypothetical protein